VACSYQHNKFHSILQINGVPSILCKTLECESFRSVIVNCWPTNCYRFSVKFAGQHVLVSIHPLTHSWSWALLEKSLIVQILKNYPAFYGTRRFITGSTRALYWSLSWDSSIQSIPSHYISLRSVLILSTHLRPGIYNSLFPSGFPTNILYAPLFSPVHATCPVGLILRDLINLIILDEGYKLWSSLLCSFLQPTVISSIFGPNILLNILFSNALKFHTHTEPQAKL
jgi:hypothetical protein